MTDKMKKINSVWMVSREYDGLAGAGGVKDVCRQLAESLVNKAGVAVTVIIPRYGFMDWQALGFSLLQLDRDENPSVLQIKGDDRQSKVPYVYAVDMNYTGEERRESISCLYREINGVRVLLVETLRFAEKLGVYTYTAAEEDKNPWQNKGNGHLDYFAMNILLQKSALEIMILLDEHPDVIHCHDGHAATLPAIMREDPRYHNYFRNSGAVVTVHNGGLGYHQEIADLPFAQAITALPESVILDNLLDDKFDPFLAASRYARLNTVSESYAYELQETSEDARTGWLGHHLLKRGVRLVGITNGINPHDFDPLNSEKLGLAAPFDPGRGIVAGKKICKEELLASCADIQERELVDQTGSLSMDVDLPLFTFIGRLTDQKGVDILLDSLNLLLEDDHDFQLLVLGSGTPDLELQLAALARQKNGLGRICFLRGYDPALAFQVYAAGDLFLIPSLYEPCGLTDYIAQLLGNLPVVHTVGGLVKVKNEKTGFSYREHSPEALKESMERALLVYRNQPEQILTMQKEAVRVIHERFTWEKVMTKYLDMYDQAMNERVLKSLPA
jgi:starch synthase